MDKIIFPIKDELQKFENSLKKVIHSMDNFLIHDLEKFIFTNPKRLRPTLIFLFAKILKIESFLVQEVALITELIHSASLIHDDIIDEEKIRRNNPTFYKKYGSKLAVLEGDLLLSVALEKLSSTTLEISKIFASRIKKTIQGEISQNENLDNLVDIETYLDKTYAKTSNLFIVGLEALFSIGKFDNNLLNFIEYYSVAFQIKNDIENFKNAKTDYNNGNYTLPVIYSSIEKSVEYVEDLTKKALMELEKIEDSIFKNSLIELVEKTLRS